jgi:hypothetical protein
MSLTIYGCPVSREYGAAVYGWGWVRKFSRSAWEDLLLNEIPGRTSSPRALSFFTYCRIADFAVLDLRVLVRSCLSCQVSTHISWRRNNAWRGFLPFFCFLDLRSFRWKYSILLRPSLASCSRSCSLCLCISLLKENVRPSSSWDSTCIYLCFEKFKESLLMMWYVAADRSIPSISWS